MILARSQEQAEGLFEILWEFDVTAFIPHQIAGDDDDAITAVVIVPPGVKTHDRALAINLRDECAEGAFERVLEVVAADPAEREGSRVRWAEYKRRGFEVTKHDM
jgi:DNA polymerase-3 subunit chi